MKNHLVIAGTVLLGTLNAVGKERLMMQQVMIVTPRTAEALGLSYESLWDALKVENTYAHGTPIVVRLSAPPVEAPSATASTTTPAPTPTLNAAAAAAKVAPIATYLGPVATLPLEKATLAPDKHAFVRS